MQKNAMKGTHFSKIRRYCGISQQELAKAADRSRQWVRQWENKPNVPPNVVALLGKLIGQDLTKAEIVEKLCSEAEENENGSADRSSQRSIFG